MRLEEVRAPRLSGCFRPQGLAVSVPFRNITRQTINRIAAQAAQFCVGRTIAPTPLLIRDVDSLCQSVEGFLLSGPV